MTDILLSDLVPHRKFLGNAPLQAFDGAEARPLTDRLRIKELGDFNKGAKTDLQWLQSAVDAVSVTASITGQMRPLRVENRPLNFGNGSLNMKSGVDLEFIDSPVTYTNKSSSGGIPFVATDQSNFRLLVPYLKGPASYMSGSDIIGYETYAAQFTRCKNAYINITTYDGNAGIQLGNCVDVEVVAFGYEMNGANVKVVGTDTERLTVTSYARNCSGFGVYGDQGAKNVRVKVTRKWMDESKFNQNSHPRLWAQREMAHKKQPFNVLSASWADVDDGQLTIVTSRNPTVDGSTWAALTDGAQVRVFGIVSSLADAFNGYGNIVSRTSSTIVIAWPKTGRTISPVGVTYTSGGSVADMVNTHQTIGEEALGLTYSCSGWRIDTLYAHRIGDVGCSLTGDRMYLASAKSIECRQGGVHISGDGCGVQYNEAENCGYWYSAFTLIGGYAATIGSNAGSYANNSHFYKVVSRRNLAGACRIEVDSKNVKFEAGGACNSAYCVAYIAPGRFGVFRAKSTVVTFGSIDPITAGFVEPSLNDFAEYTWNDGSTLWYYREAHTGDIDVKTIPKNSGFDKVSWDDIGVMVNDTVGPGYGNFYPGSLTPYTGPVVLKNGGFYFWPGGSVTASSTPAECATGWVIARSVGNATASRITGKTQKYAAKIERTAGDTSTNNIYFGYNVTGSDLTQLLNKRVSGSFQVFKGAGWTDSNQSVTWGVYACPTVSALDNDLLPSDAVLLGSGSGKVASTTAANLVTFATSDVVPADTQMLIFRVYWTPAAGTAPADDWAAYEAMLMYPSGQEVAFAPFESASPKSRLITVDASYIWPETISPATGNGVIDTDRCFIPIRLGPDTPIESLCVEVSLGVATSTVGLALYSNDHATNKPDYLIADGGTVDCSTTGIKEAPLAFTPYLDGWYWIELQGANSPNLRSTNTGRNILGTSALNASVKALTGSGTRASRKAPTSLSFKGSMPAVVAKVNL